MNRIHIIGRKNHGKTTLIVDLVEALRAMQLCVGTIKHTHHHHELDTPGKDSHRHREAGANMVGICSPRMHAVFWPEPENVPGATPASDKYAHYGTLFDPCDVVLVEGDSHTEGKKVEVWRSEVGTAPLAQEDPTILAVITDDAIPHELDAAVWPRSDMQHLVQKILSMV